MLEQNWDGRNDEEQHSFYSRIVAVRLIFQFLVLEPCTGLRMNFVHKKGHNHRYHNTARGACACKKKDKKWRAKGLFDLVVGGMLTTRSHVVSVASSYECLSSIVWMQLSVSRFVLLWAPSFFQGVPPFHISRFYESILLSHVLLSSLNSASA